MIRKIAAVLVAFAVIAAMIVGFGYRNAIAEPQIVRYRIPVAGLARPLRVVQLTDVHISPPDMPVTRVEHIVARVAALRPDLVVLTGDYLGGKTKLADRLTRPGAFNLDMAMIPFQLGLHPPLGLFAVRGNHDAAVWMPGVLDRHHIGYVNNRWIDTGPIVVAGLDDFTTGNVDIVAALHGIPDKPVLMLMHNPDAWVGVPERVALSLAGHTHGGQVVLPWIGAPRTRSIYGQRFRYGLIVEQGRRLIVSSGLGTTWVPIRFGAPPEIVEVTLVPA